MGRERGKGAIDSKGNTKAQLVRSSPILNDTRGRVRDDIAASLVPILTPC
jgi:hypothetical protein